MSNKLKVLVSPPGGFDTVAPFSMGDLLSSVAEGFSKVVPAVDRYLCICSLRFMRGLRPDLWWKAKNIRKRVKTTRFRLTWGKIRKCPDPLANPKYK